MWVRRRRQSYILRVKCRRTSNAGASTMARISSTSQFTDPSSATAPASNRPFLTSIRMLDATCAGRCPPDIRARCRVSK